MVNDTMANSQAANSTTESSSGSSSDTSSTGSSSTSSGSGSSSSDSESTTSQDSAKQKSAPAANSTNETLMRRTTPRRSTDSTVTRQNSNTTKPENEKNANVTKNKAEKAPTKTVSNNSSKPAAKPSSPSTSEDDSPQKATETKPIMKRRPSVPSKSKPTLPVNLKQPRTSTRTSQAKPPPKATSKSNDTSKKLDPPKKPLKKKSIFSPDNSSESDGEPKPPPKQKTNSTAPRPKGRPPKNSTEKPKSPEKLKPKPAERPTRRNSVKTNSINHTTPTKTAKEKDKPKIYPSKAIISSGTSTESESGTASSYDSDSSANGKKNAKTKPNVDIKTGKTRTKPEPAKAEKKQPEAAKPKESAAAPNVPTDSDAENKKPQATRKLTRLTSARKSRHALVRQTSAVLVKTADGSDTESEVDSANDSRRSLSTSPVKRGCIATKGPPALRKPIICTTNVNLAKSEEIPPLHERNCPLPGCDSLGHLSGRAERHFTLEACPMYHNTTAEACKSSWGGGSSTGEPALRKRAITSMAARRTHQPSIEQRAYQLKVKDLRSKWKPPDPKDKPLDTQPAPDGSTTVDKNEREPNLSGFVPEYDLSLFKEAQANAAHRVEEELKNLPSCKGTRYMVMGKHRMEVWYQSPYPAEVARAPELFVCEFCLAHHAGTVATNRHKAKCVWRHPPGDEVYRKGRLGVWQVDGRRHKQYCQRLCLLAKFFLDHKTLYYDVEPFLFYVMTLADTEGCHTVGYFSKEKNSFLNYNVSCILTLPPYQRQGYGRLLIDFSYLLTRVEGKVGSPEKPLSDLGLISYRSYWKDVLLRRLCAATGNSLSIRDMSQELAINSYDIVSTLQALGMMKYWKGKHIILKRQDVLDEYSERAARRDNVREIDAACLRWTPPQQNAAPPNQPPPQR